MASVQVLASIAIMIISFIAGISFFYFISPLSKTDKKQQIEEIISQLINFVIFIWIGKIILNIKLFVSDPLAVLAYPSNSYAFYIATLFITLNVGYKMKRHKLNAKKLLATFIPIFLVSSFVFEFIDIVWNGNIYSWEYLGLLTLLLILFITFQEKTSFMKLTYYLFLGWSVGKLILAIIHPFTAVFGYTISPWFLIVLSILLMMLIIFSVRKKGL